MNDQHDPLLMDHEADGIRELDNKLPRWWVWLFYGTIIFAGIYLVYFHVLGSGKLMAAEYDDEMKIGNEIKNAAMAKFESALVTMEPSKEAAVLDQGKTLFMRNCAPCHRPDGGGLVGPNLCDDYWIHGSNFVDNLKTIWNGVPEKGMVTWKGTLKPNEIYAAASFIYTLRATKPPNPKQREDQAPKQTAPSIYE
jgi:cytochrome c oxidase cbb3-type subunit III